MAIMTMKHSFFDVDGCAVQDCATQVTCSGILVCRVD